MRMFARRGFAWLSAGVLVLVCGFGLYFLTLLGSKVFADVFEPSASYTLELSTSGQGTVRVYRAGERVLLEDLLLPQPAGAEFTLTPRPAKGWAFLGWRGTLAGLASPLTVRLDGDALLRAVFVRKDGLFGSVAWLDPGAGDGEGEGVGEGLGEGDREGPVEGSVEGAPEGIGEGQSLPDADGEPEGLHSAAEGEPEGLTPLGEGQAEGGVGLAAGLCGGAAAGRECPGAPVGHGAFSIQADGGFGGARCGA